MDFEFWWLLAFPIFFGLGWLAARIDLKHLLTESRALPASYFKGLNFLMNEQPDKAIEAFNEIAKAHPQTVELQFALGSLFRRRGEIDRAIRMHQSLADRHELSSEEKLTALFELAQDYLKAGLLDRAEAILNDLKQTSYSRSGLRFLLNIYVLEKDWVKAIEMARELEGESARTQVEIGNYYCELAIAEHAHSRPAEARAYLEEALRANRRCVRANILLGEWLAKEGLHAEAIETWKRIEMQNPDYLALVAEKLMESYRAEGKLQEGLPLLGGYQERYPAFDLLNVVFQGTLESAGNEAAYRLVRDDLRRNPTLLGLDKLLEAAQFVEMPAERRGDLQLVRSLVHAQGSRFAFYRCENCGFRARQFYWQCPACGGWESYPPRRSAELDPLDAGLARA